MSYYDDIFNDESLEPDLRLAEELRRNRLTPGAVRERSGSGSVLGEVGRGVAAGVTGAIQDTIGLVDVVTGDALPDSWHENRWVDPSSTWYGALIEGFTSFGLGMLGGSAVLSGLGKVSRLARLASAAKSAVARKAGEGLASTLRPAAAGAIADFTVFDGHEARLSDLVQDYAGMELPIAEFLASDEDDPEIIGRLKAAVEGLGIGAAADVLVLGLRRIVKGRRVEAEALAAGKSPEEAGRLGEEAAREAIPDEELGEAVSRLREAAPDQPLVRRVKLSEEQSNRVYQDLFDSPKENAGDLIKRVLRRQKTGHPGGEISNARLLDDYELVLFERNPRGLNFAKAIAGREGILTGKAIRRGELSGAKSEQFQAVVALEKVTEGHMNELLADMPAATQQALSERAAIELAEMTGQGADAIPGMIRRIESQLDEASSLPARLLALQELLRLQSRDLGIKIKEFRRVPGAQREARKLMFAQILARMQMLGDSTVALRKGDLFAGQFLRSRNMMPEKMLTRLADENFMRRLRDQDAAALAELDEVTKEVDELIDSVGGETEIDRIIDEIDAFSDEPHRLPAWAAHQVAEKNTFMSRALDFWMSAILSGADTWTLTVVAPGLQAMLRPLERALGGVVTGDALARESGFRQFRGLFHDWREALKLSWQAYGLRRGILVPDKSLFDTRALKDSRRRQLDRMAFDEGVRTPGEFSPQARGIDPDTPAGRTWSFIDRVVSIPRGAIAFGDEFIKQINFRSVARDRLYRQADQMGLDQAARETFVKERMAKLIRDGESYSLDRIRREAEQIATSEGLEGADFLRRVDQLVQDEVSSDEFGFLADVSDEARNTASEVVGQEDLTSPEGRELTGGRSTLASDYQALVAQHAALRFFTPFVRTPVNLLRQGVRHLDAPALGRYFIAKQQRAASGNFPNIARTHNRTVRDLMSGDQFRVADAAGRLTFGYGLAAFVGFYAYSGRITGRGPSDPERRNALLGAGWQPYSIKTGDGYVQYSRMDPIAVPIGMMADLIETARWGDVEDMDPSNRMGLQDIMEGFVAAVSNQATQKTFLTGIRNLVNVLDDPDSRGAVTLRQFAASFIPRAVSQLTELEGGEPNWAGDPHLREVRTMWEAVQSRIPGASQRLEVRRNILGEPIRRGDSVGGDATFGITNIFLPVAYRSVSNRLIDRELASLQHGFSLPKTNRFGVDLLEHRSPGGQTAFDRWSELQAEVTLNGRTLEQSLERLMKSREYRELSTQRTPAGVSPRVQAINKILREYREEAWKRTLREYPTVRAEILGVEAARRRATHSGLSEVLDFPIQGV